MSRSKRIGLGIAALATAGLGVASIANAEELMGGTWHYGTNYLTGNATSTYHHYHEWHWAAVGTTSGKYHRDEAGPGQTAQAWLWRVPGSGVEYSAGIGDMKYTSN